MKLKNSIVVLVCLLGMSSLQAHKIDPIEDFRYPESLFEIVHEGIVHVMYMIKKQSSNQGVMQQVFEALRDIQDQYDVAYRYHAAPIKEEDREFLVSMLERVESSISSLHGDENMRVEIQDACESIRMKIMQRA